MEAADYPCVSLPFGPTGGSHSGGQPAATAEAQQSNDIM